MDKLILAAASRARASLLLLIGLWIGGIYAFVTIPKESNPDITVPVIYVSVSHDGISPEDAERLLVRPLEEELRVLEGLKKVSGTASQGHASLTLEFQAGFNPDEALDKVREKVDLVRPELPEDSDEPRVTEVNVSKFPVLNLSLSGALSEQQIVQVARELKRLLQSIPEVLEVEIAGDRVDLLELVVDPQILERYGIDYAQLFALIQNNNRLVAAGNIDTGAGRLSVKVPGLLETLPDLLGMPVKTVDGKVVTFGDIASLQRTFTDPEGFARVDASPAVVLEVKKRAGANIIETVGKVRYVVEQSSAFWPDQLEVDYIYDESSDVRSMLADLLNNVVFAIVLVVIIILGAMGPRPALLVGLTIPGAFLSGLLILQALDFTLNIVVLFSLILVTGMLVDGAIVVSEYAERELKAGYTGREAYVRAARRMAWPVIASTMTTLAVFFPLLFWPGMVGEFMKFLPATLIVILMTSLFMALVFMPVIGSAFSRRAVPRFALPPAARSAGAAAADSLPADDAASDLALVSGEETPFSRLLWKLVRAPRATLLVFLLCLGAIYVAYAKFQHGLEFFPDVEPGSAQLLIRARGDLSVYEKDRIVQLVESRLQSVQEVLALYGRTMAQNSNDNGEDVIGILTFQFTEWHERTSATVLLEHMRELTADLPVQLEFRKQEGGPGQGKPIQIQVSGLSGGLDRGVENLRARLAALEGIVDISDNRSLPGIEWRIEVNREEAARYGVDIATVGNVINLVTVGLKLADYRPEDVEKEVDIRLRLPKEFRSLEQLDRLTIATPAGPIPLSYFTTIEPAPRTGVITRVDGQRALEVKADVAEGFQADERLAALKSSLAQSPIPDVMVTFGGEDEDQRETMTFLMQAFLLALLLMLLILLIQFNSFYQALLILSAILFSTAGVLLGLLVTGQTFGVVMVGLGLIALAGIVVNNNIILIDTYNQLRMHIKDPEEAAVRTGQLRLRPVLLTAVTTVLGLLPMVLSVNVDILSRDLGLGAPSTQWWTQLSSAIAGGLTVATILTLLLTPCLLVLGEGIRLGNRKQRIAERALAHLP